MEAGTAPRAVLGAKVQWRGHVGTVTRGQGGMHPFQVAGVRAGWRNLEFPTTNR